MPDVLLFGATGYTGALTAHALARRGAEVVLAGRNLARLEKLAVEVEASDIRQVEVGDVDVLARAAADTKVLLTCVGPFWKLGHTAVEAALEAGVHYVDSTGEIAFVIELIERYDAPAKERGIVMAPALGFDEVPADVALSLATEGFTGADAVVTYSLPQRPSMGTLRTIVSGIGTRPGRWIRGGQPIDVPTASRSRWSPMPPPLGPKYAVSIPVSEGCLAPLHLDLRSLELYAAVGQPQGVVMRAGMPFMRALAAVPPAQGAIERLLENRRGGPGEKSRTTDRWMFLAEARSGSLWRNVTLTGRDPYGITAETLATGALKLAREGHESSGVIAPVEALGLERWQKQLIDLGVDIQVYEPA